MKIVTNIGDRFNNLEIIEYMPNSRGRIRTKCICGRITTPMFAHLIKMKIQSCGKGACDSRRIDILGKRFGSLLVVEYCDKKWKVKVKCDCGNEVTKARTPLVKGNTTTCGIGLCNKARENLIGRTFGFLKVIALSDKKLNGCRSTLWMCKCICGNRKDITAIRLNSQQTKSCGCLSIKLSTDTRRKPNNESAINSILIMYKRQAKDRSFNFDLSLENFSKLLLGDCFYCGIGPSNVRQSQYNRRTFYKFLYNGIDRVNNKEDYKIENCVTCCKNCNFAKRNLSQREFIDMAIRISDKHKQLLE